MKRIWIRIPTEQEEKQWPTWADHCKQVIGWYFPDVIVKIEGVESDCPQWNFEPATGYQSALLGVFCSVMKFMHLVRLTAQQ